FFIVNAGYCFDFRQVFMDEHCGPRMRARCLKHCLPCLVLCVIDSEDAIPVRIKFVVTKVIIHITGDSKEYCNSHGESNEVDDGNQFVSAKVPPRADEVMLKHEASIFSGI